MLGVEIVRKELQAEEDGVLEALPVKGVVWAPTRVPTRVPLALQGLPLAQTAGVVLENGLGVAPQLEVVAALPSVGQGSLGLRGLGQLSGQDAATQVTQGCSGQGQSTATATKREPRVKT